MADSLKIKIDGDDSGFKKSLSGIKNVAKKGFSAVTKGIAAASAGLTALTVAAVKSYGEYEQLIGGVDTLFESSSKKVQENAAKAYRTAGLSANEYMETATSFAASLKQSFDDTAEGVSAAADAADMAVIDMADNANKMGTAMESIQLAYQGFAKQNYTMLDNLKLGYGGTKEEMQRLLADAQKISGIKYDITNLADVYNAIHVIQTELGITGTTASEAATTIVGSANMMKSAWSNMIVGFADENANLDVLLDELINSVLTFADNLMPRIEASLSGIGSFASKAAETLLPEIINALVSAAPDLADAAVDTVSAFVDGISDNADSIASATVEIGVALVEGLFEIIPKVIDAAGEIISAFAEELGDTVPILKPVTKVVEMLSDNIGTLTPLVIGAVAAVKGFSVASSVTGIVKKLASSYQTAALQVGLYSAQLGVSTIANTTDAAALTAKELIVGVLTGKVSLATAAQTLWNAAMSANPIGLIIAAVALLAGGIAALVICMNQETEAEKAHREAVEANCKAVSDHAAAVRDRTEAMRESASQGLSSIAHTKNLADELLKLADAEGNVAEADRGRAEFILGELNSALGTEYQMIDGQIQKYGELQNAVYELIEAKKLEILTNAGEETYSKAITERTAVLQRQVDAYKAGGEQMKEYARLQQETAAALNAYNDAMASGASVAEIGALWQEYETLNAKTEKYLETNEELLNACWASDDAVNQNTAAITGYEEALAMAKDGNINGAIEKLTEYTYAVQTTTLGVKKAAEGTAEAVAEYGSKVEIALGGYKSALEACAKDNNASTQAMVASTRDDLEEVVQEYIDAGGEITDGFITSLDLTGKVTKIDVSDILGDVKTLEAGAISAGDTITTGFAQGMLEGKPNIIPAGEEVGDAAIDGVKTSLDAHSPSREAQKIGEWFDEGLVDGIESGKIDVVKAAGGVAKAAADAAKDELEIESPSRVMRDQVGKMITKGLAVGIDEGKTEVQKVVDEMNEELLESEQFYKDESERLNDSKLESDKEYLEELKEIADNERKVYDAMNKDLENMAKNMLDSYDKILDAQEDFAEDIKDDASLFTKNTVTIKGATEDGKDLSHTYYSLNDLTKEAEEIEKYRGKISELKNRANIPKEFYQQLKGMSVAEGTQLVDTLLKASDEEIAAVAGGWERYQTATDGLSEDLFADDFAEFKNIFESEWAEIPEGFFDIGSESSGKFSEGFMQKLQGTMAEAQQIIQNALSEIKVNVDVSTTTSANNAGVVNNNSYTYNLQSSGESNYSQIKALDDHETYKKMTNREG